MPDLLVVVLQVGAHDVSAALAEVDRPGEVVRETMAGRTTDLAGDAAHVLTALGAGHLGPRLLALAVGIGAEVPAPDATALLARLGDELPDGWGLPATLPVVAGRLDDWALTGAAVSRPAVAGAVLAAARSVGAHAHLPRPKDAG